MFRILVSCIIGLSFAATTQAAVIKGVVDGGKQLRKSPVVVYLAGVSGETAASSIVSSSNPLRIMAD